MTQTRNQRYYQKNKEALRAKARAYYLANREKIIARSREANAAWARANPERRAELQRKYATLRRYGVTPEQFAQMFAAQDGKCAICGLAGTSKGRQMAIDHDHATGKVRQLLCGNCNSMLGHAKERIETLRAAISYLEKHSAD